MNKQTLTGLIVGLVIGGTSVFAVVAAVKKDPPVQSDTQSSITNMDPVGHNVQTVTSLKELKGDDFDRSFIEEMIAHHQGAIEMAKLIETNAKHDELKKLSQDIISAQSKEIDMMQTWQGEWGYKEVPKSHEVH